MRKAIRPFVVETKSRHKSIESEMTSLIRRANAAPTMTAATPKTSSVYAGGNDTDVPERPVPRRVLPAIAATRLDLADPVAEPPPPRYAQPTEDLDESTSSEVTLPLCSRAPAASVSLSEPHQVNVGRGKPRRRPSRPEVEPAEDEIEDAPARPPALPSAASTIPAPASSPIKRARSDEPMLPSSLRWAKRLPAAVQRRLLQGKR
jgi:hypothetical protein